MVRRALSKLTISVILLVSIGQVSLACPMCRQTVESADASLAGGLNLAILVLLFPPVLIFAGIFGFIYKHRHDNEGVDAGL